MEYFSIYDYSLFVVLIIIFRCVRACLIYSVIWRTNLVINFRHNYWGRGICMCLKQRMVSWSSSCATSTLKVGCNGCPIATVLYLHNALKQPRFVSVIYRHVTLFLLYSSPFFPPTHPVTRSCPFLWLKHLNWLWPYCFHQPSLSQAFIICCLLLPCYFSLHLHQSSAISTLKVD